MNELLAYLPIAPADVPVALAAIAAAFAVLGAWSSFTVRAERARARDLVARRRELRASMIGQGRRTRAHSEHAVGGLTVSVVKRLRLLQGQKTAEIRLKLAQAGLRTREALAGFLFAKLAG